MLCTSNDFKINLTGLTVHEFRLIQSWAYNYVREKNESVTYFNQCIDDALKYFDIDEEEIYKLKEIVAAIEKDIEIVSGMIEVMDEDK